MRVRIVSSLFFLFLTCFNSYAETQKLIYHYPIYIISSDEAANTDAVNEFVSNVEGFLASDFEKVKGEVTGTVKMPVVKLGGDVSKDRLVKSLRDQYPMVAIIDGEVADSVLTVMNAEGKYPMITLVTNSKKGVEKYFSSKTRLILSMTGIDAEDMYLVPVKDGDKDRIYNLAIKGLERISLFGNQKLMKFSAEMIYKAIWDVIGQGNLSYGAMEK